MITVQFMPWQLLTACTHRCEWQKQVQVQAQNTECRGAGTCPDSQLMLPADGWVASKAGMQHNTYI
jgi:hypothetical protein